MMTGLKRSVYLEGVAATFKTTVLRTLARGGFPVVAGDYAEDLHKYPFLSRLHESREVALGYQFHCIAQVVRPSFVDRTWMATSLYGAVHSILSGTPAIEAIQEVLGNLTSETVQFLSSLKVLIVLESFPEENCLRRRLRSNGIDEELGEDYVHAQNQVFQAAGTFFNWTTIKQRKNESPLQFQHRMAVLAVKKFLADDETE